MKKNVVLCGLMDWFPILISTIKETIPNVHITPNYEEVLALVKHNKVERLSVITSGYNYSKNSSNTIEGWEVVEELQKINPYLEILVVNGAKTDISAETGLLEYLSKDSETAVFIDTETDKYQDSFRSGKLFTDFYKGFSLPVL